MSLHSALLPELFVIDGSVVHWQRLQRETEYPTETSITAHTLSLRLQFDNEEKSQHYH